MRVFRLTRIVFERSMHGNAQLITWLRAKFLHIVANPAVLGAIYIGSEILNSLINRHRCYKGKQKNKVGSCQKSTLFFALVKALTYMCARYNI